MITILVRLHKSYNLSFKVQEIFKLKQKLQTLFWGHPVEEVKHPCECP